MRETEHRFGGAWTEIKLKVLRDYLHFYTTALKSKNFNLLYIDAFAGTGERTVGDEQPSLLGSEGHLLGSASIALKLERPFDRYVFIERDLRRFRALDTLRQRYPDRRIECLRGDANRELLTLCTQTSWRQQRAVLFLDPYGLSVEWATLQRIAHTQAIDLWYLFSLSGLVRLTAHDFQQVDQARAERIDTVLGTQDWRTAFYTPLAPDQTDFFSDNPAIGLHRQADVDQIEAFVGNRLRAAGFAKVAEPLRLLSRKRAPLYSLFFCVSNPSPAAISLSMRAAHHILKAARR